MLDTAQSGQIPAFTPVNTKICPVRQEDSFGAESAGCTLECQVRFLLEEQTKPYIHTAQGVPQRKIVHGAKNTGGAASKAGRQTGVMCILQDTVL
jgi:hypothetical protein